MAEKTIFSKIIDGEIPADIVYQDDQCICIRDINPAAPTHVLVIPRKPIPRLADATEQDKALLGHLMLAFALTMVKRQGKRFFIYTSISWQVRLFQNRLLACAKTFFLISN